MEKQVFSITVNAPREKVWSTLWNDDTYRQWTAVFSPGSRAETDWKKGSKVLFLGDTNEGMVSTIAESIPNEYMSIEHLGIVKNGVEDLESPAGREWAGAHENYTLKTVNGQTEVTVDIDIADAFREYFLQTWPQALEKLKALAESN
ncbi:MAG TPA: SRPBCC domain-containing protein [Chitinophaga sp.]|uniref:SRPBCC family protein n=1 Tax=Chitinophaga sp. TaxID=1869181 RepID=UPI002DBD934A|nr:SRPBCC domain-containing protein [Chitinophaga sp.]HEU4554041.1 SRPBCC domain-containing protein [Chitinophaga sp.]